MHKYQNINCNHQTGAILVLGIYWIELVYAHQNLWKLSYFRILECLYFMEWVYVVHIFVTAPLEYLIQWKIRFQSTKTILKTKLKRITILCPNNWTFKENIRSPLAHDHCHIAFKLTTLLRPKWHSGYDTRHLITL